MRIDKLTRKVTKKTEKIISQKSIRLKKKEMALSSVAGAGGEDFFCKKIIPLFFREVKNAAKLLKNFLTSIFCPIFIQKNFTEMLNVFQIFIERFFKLLIYRIL